jgi:hypothetical protein
VCAPENERRIIAIREAHARSVALASRVRRLPPPIRAGNPERFYEERSQIAHDMNELAQRVAGGPRRPPMAEHHARKREEQVTQVINGNAVTAQRRRPGFSIFVGKA